MSKIKLFIFFIFILFITIPYLIANFYWGNKYIFTGFLLNPQDGYSYLSKMQQGYNGNWKFLLPFTSNPGEGTYLFLFYLLLGHIAKLFNLAIPLVYHFARIICSIFFLFVNERFFSKILNGTSTNSTKLLLISLSGSGMGWLIILSGNIPPDFWVAEAYPFLSCFENPHFPLGLSLILLLFIEGSEINGVKNKIKLGIYSLLLSIILPFGVVVVICIFIIIDIWYFIQNKNTSLLFPWIFIGGMPILMYQLWAIYTLPMLSIWNSQNNTPSPRMLEFIISFSPALLVSIIGLRNSIKKKNNLLINIVLVWFLIVIFLLIFPSNIQRRFITGFFIPVSIFSYLGLEYVDKLNIWYKKYIRLIFWVLLPISNIFIILLALSAVISHNSSVYIPIYQNETLQWIYQNTKKDSLILSDIELGSRIPAYTGRRVLYGHPFETINSIQEKENLIKLYDGTLGIEQVVNIIEERKIDFSVLDKKGDPSLLKKLTILYDTVYENEEYQIIQNKY